MSEAKRITFVRLFLSDYQFIQDQGWPISETIRTSVRASVELYKKRAMISRLPTGSRDQSEKEEERRGGAQKTTIT